MADEAADTYALITGASKGIGKALAEELASRKHNLLLVARSQPLLSELAKEFSGRYRIRAEYFPCDLAKAGAANEVFEWCGEKGKSISILVNNAGFGLWGPFGDLPLGEQRDMIQLNLVSLVELTHLFLPQLKKCGEAHILNVASIAAYMSVPYLNIYAAGKAFVLSFSRALRLELKGTAVNVSCLCPGPVSTEFFARAGMEKLKEMSLSFDLSPEKVAGIAVRGMFRREAEIVPGMLPKFASIVTRQLPKFIPERAAERIYRKRGKQN